MQAYIYIYLNGYLKMQVTSLVNLTGEGLQGVRLRKHNIALCSLLLGYPFSQNCQTYCDPEE